MNHYRLQVALKSGGGFELVTIRSEQEVVEEFRKSTDENRMARIASPDNPELAVLSVWYADISGWQHTPVRMAPVR